MEQKMFCYQCQETAGCKGCTMSGVCGKKPDVAAMQDLLVYVTKGISAVTTALRREGKPVSAKINHLITLNLFTTITNVNFDKESIETRIRSTLTEKEALLTQVEDPLSCPKPQHGMAPAAGKRRRGRLACSLPKTRISVLCGS